MLNTPTIPRRTIEGVLIAASTADRAVRLRRSPTCRRWRVRAEGLAWIDDDTTFCRLTLLASDQIDIAVA
jgi:hypothetical protein